MRHSVVWDTECTPDYGDCGCDNRVGEFEDISQRVDQFGDRFRALGWERTKAIWTVPQAFGGSSYWSRVPTGNEWTVQSLLAITHGALGLFYPVHPNTLDLPCFTGIVAWNAPTSSDIIDAATSIGQQLIPSLTNFTLNPRVKFATYVWQRVHFGIWRVDGHILVVGVNLNPHAQRTPLVQLPGWKSHTKMKVVYDDGGASFESGDLVLWGLGSVGLVVTV